MPLLSRRRLLATGVTALAAGLGGLAGCSSLPLVGEGSYRRWLYAPGTVEGPGHYRFVHLVIAPLVEHQAAFDDYAVEFYRNRATSTAADLRSLVGLDLEATESVLTFQGNAVLRGDFDGAAVRADLGDTGFEAAADEGGFTVYRDGHTAVGVGGSTLLYATRTGDLDAGDVLEHLVETEAGRVDRYADESEAFRELVSHLDAGTAVSGATRDPADGLLDNQVATGSTVTVDGERTDVTLVMVVESAEDFDSTDLDDVAALLADSTPLEDLSPAKSGRSALVSGSMATADVAPGTLVDPLAT